MVEMESEEIKHKIEKLKKSLNAVIVAHNYQRPEVQDIADITGDSLELARQCTQVDAEVIVFCGVHFMAESAAILSPERTVLLSEADAGCPMADMIGEAYLREWKERYPQAAVVCYVNSSAAVKALSDICCTSANGLEVVQSLPNDEVLFIPDRHLGHYLQKRTGREMKIWHGACEVHELFSKEAIINLQEQYPEAQLLAHPECEEAILERVDLIGSTTAIIKAAVNGGAQKYLIATEAGVIHQMEKLAPGKEYIPVPTHTGCACNRCPHMRLNTVEKVHAALQNLAPEIVMDEELRLRTLRPLERMLALG